MADLAYIDDGAGRPLVFLHGLSASKAMWRPVTALLAGTHRCVRVDLPGHGDSPDGRYEPLEQVAALRTVIDELDVGEPLLVGHSAGALTATLYAAVHSARGVVNVDQPLHLETFRRMVGPDPDAYRGERFDEAFDAFLDQFRIDLVPEPRRSEALTDVRPRQEVVVAMWKDVLDGTTAAVQPLLDRALAGIGCSYLALYGSEPGPAARDTVERIPRATVEVWDGHGHFLHLVDPERFVARLLTFESTLP